MTTNPYQAPESAPDGPAGVDFDSLPLTVPRRSRLERVYPILLGLWALVMEASSLWDFDANLVDLFLVAYFLVLILASLGIWRWSRVAEVIAIVQLGIIWLLATLVLCLAAWGLILGGHPAPPHTGMVLAVTVAILFLPTTVLLILAGMVWRWRSN